MHVRTLFIIGLAGFLLVSCTSRGAQHPGLEALEKNPLMADAIGNQMLEFVTLLQIHASERKQPITDPAVLRGIDDTFVAARRMIDAAHKQEDEGKRGGFHGHGDVFLQGDALLLPGSLYFGYNFDTDVAPGMRVILAQHVAPGTEEELRSEPLIDLGPLQNIVGPQEYPVPQLSNEDWNHYRTVVLDSPPLKRIMGYAQIRGKPKKD